MCIENSVFRKTAMGTLFLHLRNHEQQPDVTTSGKDEGEGDRKWLWDHVEACFLTTYCVNKRIHLWFSLAFLFNGSTFLFNVCFFCCFRTTVKFCVYLWWKRSHSPFIDASPFPEQSWVVSLLLSLPAPYAAEIAAPLQQVWDPMAESDSEQPGLQSRGGRTVSGLLSTLQDGEKSQLFFTRTVEQTLGQLEEFQLIQTGSKLNQHLLRFQQVRFSFTLNHVKWFKPFKKPVFLLPAII